MKLVKHSSFAIKCAVSVAASLLMTLSAQAQELKIGVVSLERILRDSAPAKAAAAKMEQEFSRRQKELQDMSARLKSMSEKYEKDAPVLSDSERVRRQREIAELDKDLQRKQREYREDVSQRRNEETAVVIDRTNKAIKQIAETEKYDLIIQDAIVVSQRVDITEKVLKALSNK